MRSMWTRTAVILLALLAARSTAEAGVEAVKGGIRFSYTDAHAGIVALAGPFNNWSTTANPMTKDDDGVWSIVVNLDPGKHEYKFVVDNQWIADPENPVTAGEYGNSVVNVGTDGDVVSMEATSNTAYSAKIFLGGRMISRFISRENPDRGNRFELQRPTMDFDLDWKIRANDYLDLHFLTNINNEREPAVTDFWKSNLRFDRGSIRLHMPTYALFMFDNEGAATFDDPLALVGDVGIYHHDFGYRQQGALGTFALRDLSLSLLYSDNFENGGTTAPVLDSTSVAAEGSVFDSTSMEYRFARTEVATYDFDQTAADKDVLALRATYPIRDLRVGGSVRVDRGYYPGSLSVVDADSTGAAGVQRNYGKTWERWAGGGGDLLYGGGDRPFTLRVEVLHGRSEIHATGGRAADVALETTVEYDSVFVDTIYTSTLTQTSGDRDVEDADFDVDRSTRVFLGGDFRLEGLGVSLGADWERESHEQTYFATALWDTIENTMNVYRLRTAKDVGSFLGRPWTLGLNIEFFDFDYDPRTPWRNQFWFDERNFWLDQGEHKVSVDRMVLVGGRDASFWRPSLKTTLWPAKKVDFAWRGTFAGIDLGRDPKYTENLFLVDAKPWKKIRLSSDTRLVKYTDPVLDFFDSFWSTFAEVAYEMADGIELSISYGVDPYVVDESTNEFDSIGRDMFLFDRGANGDAARRSFLGLASSLPAAEQALQDERRIQIEGIVRF